MAILYITYGGDCVYNIAMEEVLLNHSYNLNETIYRIWIQDKCIVIGYSLDPVKEVDINLAKSLKIPIIRRQSGGGAVFHDLGNLNFSLYIPYRIFDVSKVYSIGLSYIKGFLEELGLQPYIENKNDLIISGYKVSGSSVWIRGNSTLFHATLLVESDIRLLRKLIIPREDLVKLGRVTPSKYNPTNLNNFLNISINDILTKFISYLSELDKVVISKLDETKYREVKKLVDEKYNGEKWVINGEISGKMPLNLLL